MGSKEGHEHFQQELRIHLSGNFGVADLYTSAELFRGPEYSCVPVVVTVGDTEPGDS